MAVALAPPARIVPELLNTVTEGLLTATPKTLVDSIRPAFVTVMAFALLPAARFPASSTPVAEFVTETGPLLLNMAVPNASVAWIVPELERSIAPITKTEVAFAAFARIVPELLMVAVSASIAWPLAPVASIRPLLAVTLTVCALTANLSAVIMPVTLPSPILPTVAVPAAWMAMPPAAIAEIVPVLPATFWLTLTSPLFETTANWPPLVIEPVLFSVSRPSVTIAMLLA